MKYKRKREEGGNLRNIGDNFMVFLGIPTVKRGGGEIRAFFMRKRHQGKC